VNAGHNPPIVLRGEQVIRLEADGPSMVLEPGDTLLAYTDGISEAMTVDDEEWGEERMIAAALECRTCLLGR
jgi:sigma-B regulation protein RsbU (phosphoserine phosphatase)